MKRRICHLEVPISRLVRDTETMEPMFPEPSSVELQHRRFTESLIRHFQLDRSERCRSCGAEPGLDHVTGCLGANSGGFHPGNVATALLRLAERAEVAGEWDIERSARVLRNMWLAVEPPAFVQ